MNISSTVVEEEELQETTTQQQFTQEELEIALLEQLGVEDPGINIDRLMDRKIDEQPNYNLLKRSWI